MSWSSDLTRPERIRWCLCADVVARIRSKYISVVVAGPLSRSFFLLLRVVLTERTRGAKDGCPCRGIHVSEEGRGTVMQGIVIFILIDRLGLLFVAGEQRPKNPNQHKKEHHAGRNSDRDKNDNAYSQEIYKIYRLGAQLPTREERTHVYERS